ncbi:hypothetical protein C9374_006867 [Naegleria lovaniensis]|uniref:Uncharacterized protein n=1 Tax=Naegleria lovaniensis TaxID=51637 RepID=A0AA88KRI7_NAELO|nr:uncharacterized protein C9374_006867 [Naegleria lovaniensis]KAG2393336.1 hypothetical protein C9374_006867 [Naegleria lovaniensis]
MPKESSRGCLRKDAKSIDTPTTTCLNFRSTSRSSLCPCCFARNLSSCPHASSISQFLELRKEKPYPALPKEFRLLFLQLSDQEKSQLEQQFDRFQTHFTNTFGRYENVKRKRKVFMSSLTQFLNRSLKEFGLNVKIVMQQVHLSKKNQDSKTHLLKQMSSMQAFDNLTSTETRQEEEEDAMSDGDEDKDDLGEDKDDIQVGDCNSESSFERIENDSFIDPRSDLVIETQPSSSTQPRDICFKIQKEGCDHMVFHPLIPKLSFKTLDSLKKEVKQQCNFKESAFSLCYKRDGVLSCLSSDRLVESMYRWVEKKLEQNVECEFEMIVSLVD